MKAAAWPDEGTVLSFTRLQAMPEGLEDPYNLALVVVQKGPKLVCWTSVTLKEEDRVSITERNGKFFCTPWAPLEFKLDEGKLDDTNPAPMKGLSGGLRPKNGSD